MDTPLSGQKPWEFVNSDLYCERNSRHISIVVFLCLLFLCLFIHFHNLCIIKFQIVLSDCAVVCHLSNCVFGARYKSEARPEY